MRCSGVHLWSKHFRRQSGYFCVFDLHSEFQDIQNNIVKPCLRKQNRTNRVLLYIALVSLKLRIPFSLCLAYMLGKYSVPDLCMPQPLKKYTQTHTHSFFETGVSLCSWGHPGTLGLCHCALYYHFIYEIVIIYLLSFFLLSCFLIHFILSCFVLRWNFCILLLDSRDGLAADFWVPVLQMCHTYQVLP